jgi:hypothetical protein
MEGVPPRQARLASPNWTIRPHLVREMDPSNFRRDKVSKRAGLAQIGLDGPHAHTL